MPSLPDAPTDTTPAPEDATCVVRAGERVEILNDGFAMPDGHTQESLSGCKLESGAILFTAWGDPSNRLRPLPKRKLQEPPPPPEDVSEIAPDTFATTLVGKPVSAHLRSDLSSTSTAVVAAVAVAALGVAAFKAFHLGQGSTTATQAQQQREREQRECGTKSDTVRDRFAHTLQSLQAKKPTEIREPDVFFAKIDGMLLELKVLPKGRKTIPKGKNTRKVP